MHVGPESTVPSETRKTPIAVCPLSLQGLREYRSTVRPWTLVLLSPKNEPSWGQGSSPHQRPTAFGMQLPHEGRTSRLCFYQANVSLPCGKKFASRGIYSVSVREWTTFSARSTCIT